VERGAAGLRLESEPVAELGEPGAAAAGAAGPDQNGAIRVRHALLELPAELRLRHVDDLGAVAARLTDPEIDDRSAVGNLLVTDHDDDLGVPDRRQRRPEGVEPVRNSFGHDRGMRAEALTQELAERVCLLDGLRAGERGHDAALGAAQQLLGAVERVGPGELHETPPLDAFEGIDDSVAGIDVRVGEAALVAEPTLVHLGVVA
jgi:hypothetical protein